MNDSQKIEELLHHFRMDQKEFAEKCGFNPRIVSNIKRGVCGMSKKVTKQITDAFPDVNKAWLLEGEGPMMLIGAVNMGGEKNTVQNTATESIVRSYQKIIEKQQEQVDKYQEQIDKLIAVIGKLTEK